MLGMKRITDKQIELIKNIAEQHNGTLLKPNGDGYTFVSLASFLTKDAMNLDRLRFKVTGKPEAEYQDDIWWLLRRGYIKVQQYPYRIVLTEKFNGLKADSLC